MTISKDRLEIIRKIRINKSFFSNKIVKTKETLFESSEDVAFSSLIYNGFKEVLATNKAYSEPDSMIDALQKLNWKLIRAGIEKYGWSGMYGMAEEVIDEFDKPGKVEGEKNIDEDTSRQLDWKQSRNRKKKQVSAAHKKHTRHLKEYSLNNIIEYCELNEESILDTPLIDKPSHMVKANLYQTSWQAAELEKTIEDFDEIAPWIETKIAFATNEINAIYNHMLYRLYKFEEGELKSDTGEEKIVAEQGNFKKHKKNEQELDWESNVKEYPNQLGTKKPHIQINEKDLEIELWKALSEIQKKTGLTDPYELLSSTLDAFPEIFRQILDKADSNKLLTLSKKVIGSQKNLSYRKNLNEIISSDTEKLLETIHDVLVSIGSLRLRGMILKKSENINDRKNGIKAIKVAEKIYNILELLSNDLTKINH